MGEHPQFAIRVDQLTTHYLQRLLIEADAELGLRVTKLKSEGHAVTFCGECHFRIGHESKCSQSVRAAEQMEAGGLLISQEVAGGEAPRRAADPFRNSRNVPMPCVACHTPTDCMAGKVTCALDTVQDSANSAGGPSDGLEPWREAAKTILEGVHGTGLLEELLRRRLRTMLGAQRPDHARRHPHEAYMLMLRAAKHLASARRALAEAGDTVAAQ